MAKTYEAIATTTLGSANGTITFSSIPQTYTDLKLIFIPQYGSVADVGLRFNGVSTNTYYRVYVQGAGSGAAQSGSNNGQSSIYLSNYGISSGNYLMYTVDVFSYTVALPSRQILYSYMENKNGSGAVGDGAGMYDSSAAITSISLVGLPTATFGTGSIATLYGIKAA